MNRPISILIMLCIWVAISTSLLASKLGIVDKKAFDKLTDEANHLSRKCKRGAECIDTGFASPMCHALCGGCGLVISKQELAKFEEIKRKASKLGYYPCLEAQCASGEITCELACIDHKCSGKTVIKNEH